MSFHNVGLNPTFYSSGTWGTITDSDWTSDDAQVVCHKLGHFKPGVNNVLCILIVVTTLKKLTIRKRKCEYYFPTYIYLVNI